jgi:serine/threonine protein phosphatase Stp1
VNIAALRIESEARTHAGKVRAINEDRFVAREDCGFWAVADGMGGHEHGEWASAKLAEELDAVAFAPDFVQACNQVAAAITAANQIVHDEAQRRKTQMGSTIVALYLREQRYAAFWVGDSRAYVLRGGQLRQLSKDHSQVQEMVDRGLMDASDAEGHPMSHVLTRAIGVRSEVEVSRADGEVEPGDTFLLCSDGLHGYVEEEEIFRLLRRGAAGEASAQLVEATLERGAPDNVTVVTISVSEPTLLSLPGSGELA